MFHGGYKPQDKHKHYALKVLVKSTDPGLYFCVSGSSREHIVVCVVVCVGWVQSSCSMTHPMSFRLGGCFVYHSVVSYIQLCN